jgi:signal transduction histidine kinase
MVEAEKNGPQPQGAATTSSFEVTADYLGGLVHELRNPLSPIRTATELLRSLSSDPRQLQAIDLISRQVVTLTHMLDDLIEAARGHRGLLALVRRSIDMAELIERVLEAVRPTIDAQRQNLFVSLPSTPVHMECDPLRLGQVLQVLLHNAIQYTPPGGSLALRARRDGAELVMEVSDDGAGIAAEALPHLFNVFARSPPNGALTAQDVGFSLALARNVIELHGGRLTAASEGVGRGSTFTLRLPIRYEASAPELTKEGPDARPLRIIIIDDHQESVRGWLECMVRAGHSVLTASRFYWPRSSSPTQSWSILACRASMASKSLAHCGRSPRRVMPC